MLRVNREIESEEVAQCFEAIQADVCAEYDGKDSDNEEGSYVYVLLGISTDDGCSHRRDGCNREVGLEVEQYFEHSAHPNDYLVNLDAKSQSLDEQHMSDRSDLEDQWGDLKDV